MAMGMRIGISTTQRLRLTASLQASIWVLRTDASGLALYLEEQAAKTPALVLSAPPLPMGEWLPRWTGVWHPDKGGDSEAYLAANAPSLIAHVLTEIGRLVPPSQGRIALALAEALEPTGWLGRDIAGLAAELAVDMAEVEAVLATLHEIDPPGLFARDLAECLRLQAVEAGCHDAVMAVMLGRLDLVAAGDWRALARLAEVPEVDVMARFRTLRSFNPKPGTAFSAMASPLREPDLLVTQGEAGWEVALNRSSLPAMSVQPGAKGAVRAREVIALIDNRNTTLLAVGREILAHQCAALDGGPEFLRPLKMQTVANVVGLHKSTVSRVVAGAAVDTPHGTWWLRSLFSVDMGGDTGGAALRAQLALLIAAEDRTAPASDDEIARALSGEGRMIARRTVAKYRSELRIPASYRRRIRA